MFSSTSSSPTSLVSSHMCVGYNIGFFGGMGRKLMNDANLEMGDS